MSIEKLSFFDNLFNIDEEQFIADLRSDIKCQNMKVVFVHNPKFKNIQQTNIDLLLIIAVENKNKNFYIAQKNNNSNCYLYNVILPIKFIHGYESNKVTILNDNLDPKNYCVNIDDKIELDFTSEIQEIKRQTEHYLKSIWQDYKNSTFFINPLIWIFSQLHSTIQNSSYKFSVSNIIQAPNFGYWEIKAYLNYGTFCNGKTIYKSIPNWSIKNNTEAYEKINQDIDSLIKKLEKDRRIGYLTKSKLERITNLYQKDIDIYEKYLKEKNNSSATEEFTLSNDTHKKTTTLALRIKADKEMFNNLIIISGKAGSGKTSELLLLIKKRLEDGKKVRYLTYNKLLVNQANNTIRHNNFSFHSTSFSCLTIHKQIYRFAKQFGNIFFIMNLNRIRELEDSYQMKKNILINYCKKFNILKFDLKDVIRGNSHFFEFLHKHYQKDTYDFAYNYLIKTQKEYIDSNTISTDRFIDELEKYTSKSIERISNNFGNEIFLKDYYNVLNNILLILKDSDKFYDDFKLADLSPSEWLNIASRGNNIKNIKYNNTKEDFKKLVNQSRGGFSAFIPFIDEAQDCHELEREIFFELYNKKNMVIATGGEEQLIRHEKVCNWKINSQGIKHNIIEIDKKNNSYRLSKKHVELCNFLANKFEIELNLQASRNDDGELIIDLLNDSALDRISTNFKRLAKLGEKNGYLPSESVMVLVESSSDLLFEDITKSNKENYVINEFNNIVVSENRVTDRQCYLKEILNYGAKNNWRDEEGYPIFYHNFGIESFDEAEEEQFDIDDYVALFYESCRGSEAYSIMCLELDKFYERKQKDPIAAKYRSDDLLLTEEDRRKKYAMIWVLMALTRAINSIYIQISDNNSELGKLLIEYINKQPN